ncbi:hypothetical protein AMECASPLE_038986 [Ameca splendens]|uniref:Uncharacterized protein n=1 Tax=Ameca splendens TaxID=208324 RepID=A0ABV0ZW12_9TELE
MILNIEKTDKQLTSTIKKQKADVNKIKPTNSPPGTLMVQSQRINLFLHIWIDGQREKTCTCFIKLSDPAKQYEICVVRDEEDHRLQSEGRSNRCLDRANKLNIFFNRFSSKTSSGSFFPAHSQTSHSPLTHSFPVTYQMFCIPPEP